MSEQMISMLEEILQKVEGIEKALNLNNGAIKSKVISDRQQENLVHNGINNAIMESWEKAKKLIKAEMTEGSYNSLITPLEIYKLEGRTLVFTTQTVMQKEMMETRYKDLIVTAVNFDNKLIDSVKFLIK
ncbi:DnaA N-terminal domain-containing protein [Clostridium oryzae]|uniref:Chromosomal replication initiation protein n=1 Tax=Clostridium oryzae TaxID=1450648 RepID=A0A1V4IRT2_9CLOT|nr:DnaA N-terminal domain-containing protein [Clostridium oryzae]OPJ62599.1 chromosomal replication initiation protein [Clostridium oryzae]